MLGFIGGTGPEGKGLALRFAISGMEVFIGSREKQRGIEAAENLVSKYSEIDSTLVKGGTNEKAASDCEIAVICTPYAGHKGTLENLKQNLAGKIVVDVVAPLSFQKGSISAIEVEDGSAAEEAQLLLPESNIVGAFQNVSAEDLLIPSKQVTCDVIVCSNNQPAKEQVMLLGERIPGIRSLDGGNLENSKYVEQLTALLININKIYKSHSSIKIVGI
ncbi:MAG: NADPH-dependent F420 reductase [Dehalococcoidia bacterium]|tara:strand:- start:133 stop:786 length:654 start_codon:yes stop_codon:yes gene_type:complete